MCQVNAYLCRRMAFISLSSAWVVQLGLCLPPPSEFMSEALADLIFRLAVLIPSDAKVLKSAKQAVHAAVSALKVWIRGTKTSHGVFSYDDILHKRCH